MQPGATRSRSRIKAALLDQHQERCLEGVVDIVGRSRHPPADAQDHPARAWVTSASNATSSPGHDQGAGSAPPRPTTDSPSNSRTTCSRARPEPNAPHGRCLRRPDVRPTSITARPTGDDTAISRNRPEIAGSCDQPSRRRLNIKDGLRDSNNARRAAPMIDPNSPARNEANSSEPESERNEANSSEPGSRRNEANSAEPESLLERPIRPSRSRTHRNEANSSGPDSHRNEANSAGRTAPEQANSSSLSRNGTKPIPPSRAQAGTKQIRPSRSRTGTKPIRPGRSRTGTKPIRPPKDQRGAKLPRLRRRCGAWHPSWLNADRCFTGTLTLTPS